MRKPSGGVTCELSHAENAVSATAAPRFSVHNKFQPHFGRHGYMLIVNHYVRAHHGIIFSGRIWCNCALRGTVKL